MPTFRKITVNNAVIYTTAVFLFSVSMHLYFRRLFLHFAAMLSIFFSVAVENIVHSNQRTIKEIFFDYFRGKLHVHVPRH